MCPTGDDYQERLINLGVVPITSFLDKSCSDYMLKIQKPEHCLNGLVRKPKQTLRRSSRNIQRQTDVKCRTQLRSSTLLYKYSNQGCVKYFWLCSSHKVFLFLSRAPQPFFIIFSKTFMGYHISEFCVWPMVENKDYNYIIHEFRAHILFSMALQGLHYDIPTIQRRVQSSSQNMGLVLQHYIFKESRKQGSTGVKWTTLVNSPCLFTFQVQIWSLCDHPVRSYG